MSHKFIGLLSCGAVGSAPCASPPPARPAHVIRSRGGASVAALFPRLARAAFGFRLSSTALRNTRAPFRAARGNAMTLARVIFGPLN